jgi:putative hydrolases of HD superfamily
MQIRKGLLLELLKAAYMQRWNDKLRPIDLVELDKQAHKMIIAYFLGKWHEQDPGFSWKEIIAGGLFDFLQRIVVTDLKPQIYSKITTDAKRFESLVNWVYKTLEPVLVPLGEDFGSAFRSYFTQPTKNINRRILSAAHVYATLWEFQIIERENPHDYEIEDIKQDLEDKQNLYADLRGVQILNDHIRYQKFINLCGQLRFQIRWSRIHRVPRTSVLGHMLYVAILAYLFSLSVGASERRCVNNFFTGLFHDLPEALTRDIISPVKRAVAGLDELIKNYEHEEMQKVYQLLPAENAWQAEMKMYTEHEFEDVTAGGEIVRDGQMVEAIDKLAAFVEAYEAIQNGSPSSELKNALESIRGRYGCEGRIAGVDFAAVYREF